MFNLPLFLLFRKLYHSRLGDFLCWKVFLSTEKIMKEQNCKFTHFGYEKLCINMILYNCESNGIY
jgi:hypothetical protein